MKDIKYRVWDKDSESMLAVDSINFPLGKPSWKDITIDIGGDLEWRCIDEVVLMQYTGINDLDNNEVYEGDILKVKIQGWWQDNLYIVKDLREFYTEMNRDIRYYRFSSVQVIGNIYENPDLLN